MLYKMIKNQKLEEPFNKVPPDGPLPKLANSFVNTSRPARQTNTRMTPTAKAKSTPKFTKDSPKKKSWPLAEFVNPAPYMPPGDYDETAVKRLLEDEIEKEPDPADIEKIRHMLDVSQQQEKNLRDELVQRSRAISEQTHTINTL